MSEAPMPSDGRTMTESDMAFYYWFHQNGNDDSFKDQRLAFMAGWNAGKSSSSQTRAS